MNKIIMMTLLCLVFTAIPAKAQSTYKPGSLGYLYEDCKKALASGTALREVYGSYCGAFVEGYFTGAMIANAVNLPPPSPQDPCFADKSREYERINNRLCPNLPQYDPKKASAAEIMQGAAGVVARWAEFLGKTNPKSDPLESSAAGSMNSLLAPGKFCDTLNQNLADDNASVFINEPLLKIDWKEYIDVQNEVSLMKKYEMCKAEYKEANGDPKKFRASRCGAEVIGFIAGLRSTVHLQTREAPANPACTKEIDRLYRGLNVAESMCVTPDTDPMLVAHIFLERVESMPEKEFQRTQQFANLKSIGAVGYESIYRGFLCARKN